MSDITCEHVNCCNKAKVTVNESSFCFSHMPYKMLEILRDRCDEYEATIKEQQAEIDLYQRQRDLQADCLQRVLVAVGCIDKDAICLLDQLWVAGDTYAKQITKDG